jgi:tetratricopeptide (TPR) repeat protein
VAQNVNLEFIERYQLVMQKDPKSKVFAPLGEAYRKMGLLKEAEQILTAGVKNHPHFASGRVSLAKLLIDQSKYAEAAEHLKIAVEVATENILAHKLLAECYMKTRQPKLALKSFKMTLFLNPDDAYAKEFVQKLESLTADEYEDEVFEMKALTERDEKKQTVSPIIEKKIATLPLAPHPVLRERQLERIVSLVDAFIARGDINKASEVLKQGEIKLGTNDEFEKRMKFINSRVYNEVAEFEEPLLPIVDAVELVKPQKKIDFLNALLQRIHDRRLDLTSR